MATPMGNSRDLSDAGAMALSLGQRFEIERFNRAIDATADPGELRRIAKQLLQAWHTQKAATNWVISQQRPPEPPLQQS